MTPHEHQQRILRMKSPATPLSARGLSFADSMAEDENAASPANRVDALCEAFASARVHVRGKRAATSSPFARDETPLRREPMKRSSLRATPAAFTVAPAQIDLGTAVFSPDDCLSHGSLLHQESPARITAIREALSSAEFEALQWHGAAAAPAAPITDVLRVHELAYIEHLRARVAAAGERAAADVDGGAKLDCDTMLTRGSLQAALVAAGAACAAVDAVMRGESRTALCVVRPPGHHVGYRGAVSAPNFGTRPEMCSNGFGLLNTVAIAAAHARAFWGRSGALQRVAIVDFDIHHGNGTEDIVRNLRPRRVALPLPTSWAPQLETVYKPWLNEHDHANVFFGSVHLFDGDSFYPCSGGATSAAASNKEEEEEEEEEALIPIPARGVHATPNIVNVPMPFVGSINPAARRKARFAKGKKSAAALTAKASAAYRERVLSHLLPRLEAFRPELILISAGFDGHCDDHYYYLGDSDYAWLTAQIVAVAARWGEGRVVSVLEGGYAVAEVPKASKAPKRRVGLFRSASSSRLHGKRGALAEKSEAPVEAADAVDAVEEEGTSSTPLGRAVAAHVRALMTPAEAAPIEII